MAETRKLNTREGLLSTPPIGIANETEIG